MTNLGQQQPPESIPVNINEQAPVSQEGINDKIKRIDEWFDLMDQVLIEVEKRIGPVTSENFWDKVKDNNLLTREQWDGIFTGPLQERESGQEVRRGMKEFLKGPESSRGEVDNFALTAERELLGKLKYE